MSLPLRRIEFEAERQASIDPSREWLVTNGLGGYASGPVCGGLTRRYHGMLIAALPSPVGRLVYASALRTRVFHGDRAILIDHENFQSMAEADAGVLRSFCLEGGLPVWRYESDGLVIEKRVFMPHRQNATCLTFTLLHADRPVHVECQPWLHVRPIESAPPDAGTPVFAPQIEGRGAEIALGDGLPSLRLVVGNPASIISATDEIETEVGLVEEHARGYGNSSSRMRSNCSVRLAFDASETASLVFAVGDLAPEAFNSPLELLADELDRRTSVLARAGSPSDEFEAQLALAADQFLIVPVGHDSTEAAPDHAPPPHGAAARTIIAGYHWFTDWGRDTMISLEGLTLELGRDGEAARILRMFARHVRDGLLPNLFPEGARSGLYHTADATLWFFHAIHRYVVRTGDRDLVTDLLPVLEEILTFHRRGTRFGIGVDPADGLLRQGAEGFQLTWMDAKVDDWVVTPRRGKAVEINALWYNALCRMEEWLSANGRADDAAECREEAARAQASFNSRFWNPDTGWLFDVVDGEHGDDPACRPNQIFAISLPSPVLNRDRWMPVLDTVRSRLVTPFGLRSLSPDHPDYQSQYTGDLRSRDASYHQGTVWAWLIGPYVDALIRTCSPPAPEIRSLLGAFDQHLSCAGVGTISEIFDADMPHLPRGCIAQAWSVAEVLRSWKRARE